MIERQLHILRDFITKNIDSDYVYVDVPLYWNIGDWLIAMGAWELLKAVPFRCLGKLRWFEYERTRIKPNTIILLQGGGNFGDLWRGATEMRNEVIEKYPNNKIIILPQTITYLDRDLLKKDAEIYSRHKNLHICARDNASYEILREYFHENYLYLLPDTSIGLYPSLPKNKKSTKTSKSLIINRKDKEADALFEAKNGEEKEWDDILRAICFPIVWQPYRLIRYVRKRSKNELIFSIENRYVLNVLYPYVRKNIPRYFLQYSEVKTTRLHGYLLASMLHMPVEIIDNKYHKLSNYITTWRK